ncbi:hypothetical protein CDL15_Pgr000256 [Punica granatum]|uniref:Uncharacterized protein n=1 Tax=Punica granatum TaxID=22663 RepID=A0A218Y449_PUNGR|nr:hypothetical protein CDL15_Pgr000256 [Punica granatum]
MEYLCGYGENAETGEPMNGYNYGWPENNGGSNSRQSSVCSNGYLYGVKDDLSGRNPGKQPMTECSYGWNPQQQTMTGYNNGWNTQNQPTTGESSTTRGSSSRAPRQHQQQQQQQGRSEAQREPSGGDLGNSDLSSATTAPEDAADSDKFVCGTGGGSNEPPLPRFDLLDFLPSLSSKREAGSEGGDEDDGGSSISRHCYSRGCQQVKSSPVISYGVVVAANEPPPPPPAVAIKNF